MNRFRTSKFKNTSARVSKKENWIGDIRAGSAVSYGNLIKSSYHRIAFSTDCTGILGILPLQTTDGKAVSHLHCHADVVTDFDFSPFDDFLLATCSADETVKLWRLPKLGEDMTSSADIVLGPEGCHVETLKFHPACDGVLASANGKIAKIWNLIQKKTFAVMENHGDQIQSVAWKQDGSLLGTSCKDKNLRIFDPRTGPSATQSTQGHANNKDSRLIWINDSGTLLSSGFSQMREREVKLWDMRSFKSSISSLSLDTSQGVIMPVFDVDTGLLILAGKGDNVLYCIEVCASPPSLSQVNQILMEGKTRGIGLIPKPAIDVMSCEVLRALQLTDTFIVPISYEVPRKSHQEFHTDLFPDTAGNIPSMTAEEWWNGANKQVEKVTLHPARSSRKPYISICVPKPQAEEKKTKTSIKPETKELPLEAIRTTESSPSSPSSSVVSPSTPSSLVHSLSTTSGLSSGFVTSSSQKSLQSITGLSSKFRHVEGKVLHRDLHITNLKGLNLTVPGESDGFCVNQERVAVPLAAAGGQIAVLEISKPGRLPDASLPTIQNGGAVADLSWDPFDNYRLAVAGEDAKIRIWKVPVGGLTETIAEPKMILRGHTEKIYSIKFHPLASDILASTSYDMSVRIWNLCSGSQEQLLLGHKDQIFGLAWSPDGQHLATVSKDGKVRIYNPRQSAEPVQEGPGPEGSRGARLVWVCDGKFLLVSGFNSRSERQLYLYGTDSLSSGPVSTISNDVSPSTLIPFYDEDTSTVFLTGKGDTRVYVYEILSEPPYFLECNSFSSADPHKGLAFLPKTECNVRDVEFAKALRLGSNTLEPVIFRVPRVKKEYFQDDIFPDTAVWWKPALTGKAWLSGSSGKHQKISLQPKDMTPVSLAPKEVIVRKYAPSSVYLEEKTDEQKKEELLSAMVSKLGNLDDPLPQDAFEGVDEEEWDD
ncbi:coronin-7-like [Protopterus annectens]|uniref:coronin-7-like n=1 Tax=Protopterus annectens TaxID=7888 RepID=UPI001CFB4F7E|nr:coronin-7-like [Protopterus annectens]